MEPATIYYEEFNDATGAITRPNQNLKSAKSDQYVISYDHNLTSHMRLKLEAYYQHHWDVPVASDPASTFSAVNNVYPITGYTLVNKGTAANKGIELTLEKFLSQNYYFLLTGSLYDATYKAIDGVTRDTRFNGTYVANFLFGKEFPLQRNRSIGLDFRFIVAGGNRTTPIDLEASRANRTTVYLESEAFTDQAPTYFRPDFKISFTKNKENSKRILSLDIQNVSNQQNLLVTGYDKIQDDVVKQYQFGMLPNIAYRIEF